MNVLLKDLDPQVAEKIKARVTFLLNKQNHALEELPAYEALRERRTNINTFVRRTFVRMAQGAVGGTALGTFGMLFGDNLLIGIGAAFGGWLGGIESFLESYVIATNIGQDVNAKDLRAIL